MTIIPLKLQDANRYLTVAVESLTFAATICGNTEREVGGVPVEYALSTLAEKPTRGRESAKANAVAFSLIGTCAS
jgi:hypothetical protein